jgi:hypothetical protein
LALLPIALGSSDPSDPITNTGNAWLSGFSINGNNLALQSARAGFAMEILMLIGFAGAIILLGFLSCLAGGTSEGRHLRRGRNEFENPKWPTRR